MAAAKKSKLPAKTNQRRNTKAGRAAMAPGSFALPAQKAYRLDDLPHARNALTRVAQHGTPAEQAKVKAAVRKKYPSIAVGGKTPAKTKRKGGK
jgi:hypothetical protein